MFWHALEDVPGGAALYTTWKRQLQNDFDAFNSLFLRAQPGEPATAVPCPWSCGCSHIVVLQDNGTFLGVCQCNPSSCGTYTVLPFERITWEVDLPKLAHAICPAFQLKFKFVKLGLYNITQIGTWIQKSTGMPDAVPAILTLPSSSRELLHTTTQLVARLNRSFILIAPTNRHFTNTASELLETIGSIFLPLDRYLTIQPNSAADGIPVIQSTFSTAHFESLSPPLPHAPDQDLVTRLCNVLDDLDTTSRRKNPTLAAVYKLYFVQELPIAQVAKKCRCSVGTIVNRLKLIESKSGASTAQLRRISPQFTDLHDSLASAKSDFYRRRKQNL